MENAEHTRPKDMGKDYVLNSRKQTLIEYRKRIDAAMQTMEALHKDICRQLKTYYSEEDIIQVIVTNSGFTREEIKSKSRKTELVAVKNLCTYFLKEKTPLSWKAIGEAIDGADHSTSMYRYEKLIEEVEQIQNIPVDLQTRHQKTLMKLVFSTQQEL